MADHFSRLGNRALLGAFAASLVLIGGIGGWFWQAQRLEGDPAAGLGAANRAAIEKVVHDYILAHPEILPQAMDNLRLQESAKQLSGIRSGVEKPFPGAVLGNPAGKITLVEFTDFACTYCRQSVADIAALVAENPDLKVVIRELPILSPLSADASRWALAAADQGKYRAFHDAMFAIGRPSAETITAAATKAGLDMTRARQFAASPGVQAEIDRNLGFARQLGFDGTPSWVVGDEVISGAVGKDRLAEAIAKASS